MYAERGFSGELFGSGTKLLYAPHSEETTDTHSQTGRYSFVWDVAENRGYVMSDALQGYAPIASSLRVTNVSLNISQTAAQRVSGHTCEPATATVQLNDGSTTEFELLRAVDLKGFPIHIEKKANPAFTLSLSKIHLEPEPTDAFSPPDGFTKYPTPEALADELAVRQSNLRRRSSDQTPMIPGMQQPHY